MAIDAVLPVQFDIWSSIQSQKTKQLHEQESPKQDEPYVHPLTRRSSSRLSQKSLEVCTESLGSETGSDGYFTQEDVTVLFFKTEERQPEQKKMKKDQQPASTAVNYYCSSRSRCPPPRSFPPPLPSISCRDGPCLQMRPHRKDGRLVVEAVTVPLQNYLHAERYNGRLLLSFINPDSSSTINDQENVEDEEEADEMTEVQEAEEAEDEDEEEDAEEVEVVDRGTVVEVKVSTQQATKVHRSSIVINKFVSYNEENHAVSAAAVISDSAPLSPVRRLSSTTTAAAAAVAASSVSGSDEGEDGGGESSKMVFATSKRRNKEELVHEMRRCRQLRKPLFIWEPCCIATSS